MRGTKRSRKLSSILTIVVALAVALTGTFAWQSINQMALNETMPAPYNPGGRLHDDFSGWYTTSKNGGYLTKDIYVENFGSEYIYARVRLEEYMEIGEGAGVKKGDEGDNNATPLAASWTDKTTGATITPNIDDTSTWAIHIPSADNPAVGAEVIGDMPTKSFHNYWTWTMGGQAADNPNGSTVYMPTFNKNTDSMQADINGTLAGSSNTDKLQYDDYYRYKAYFAAYTDESGKLIPESGDKATGARGATEEGAFYDADDNLVEEGKGTPNDGKYGNGGTAGKNYTVVAETHYAVPTLPGKVMTMAQWLALPDDDPGDNKEWKGNVLAWVYDTDGWAYWSQPIAPGTATGLLMDRLEPTQALKDLTDSWYYAINAVAQFITKDDLGRADNPQTGFYDANSGRAPTENALKLLESIGVDVSEYRGTVEIGVKGGDLAEVDAVATGGSYTLSAVVTAKGVGLTEDNVDQTVTWALAGNVDTETKIVKDEGTGIYTLTVGKDETATELTLTARSEAYGLEAEEKTLSVVEPTPTESPPPSESPPQSPTTNELPTPNELPTEGGEETDGEAVRGAGRETGGGGTEGETGGETGGGETGGGESGSGGTETGEGAGEGAETGGETGGEPAPSG